MADRESLKAESTQSQETDQTGDTYQSHGASAVPLTVVSAYKHLRESGEGTHNVPQLPSHRFQYSVWHDLREACLTGTMLKAPRVREGPPEKDKAFYKMRDEEDKVIHHSRTGASRDSYRHTMENWENAKSVSLCYQELQDSYQRSSFNAILGRLQNVEHLYLTDNTIQSLKWKSFPKCEVLNLNNNFIYSFSELPSIPRIRSLMLEDNDIQSFSGLSKLRSSPIEELYLNGNPVTFTINYRPKVFQILTQLKVLDGIPKLQSDLEFQSEERLPTKSSQCTIL
ncbi:uncharacterized protein LOC133175431 [Saccostrea echinata]|uniref:uncharacterized protein LOC133175431 n=1 Tax=Saccostrea echinata TaxID=191078 RepID=UPI002A83369C|nr:uncharacterized protein LOC133175431 [Saccostrea echinata]